MHPQGLNVGSTESEDLIMTQGNSEMPKWEIEHELDGLRFQIKFNSPTDEASKEADKVPDTAITAQ